MRTHCRAQETLLKSPWCPKLEGNPKKDGLCVYVSLTHFAIRQELKQHCKNNYIPMRINKKRKIDSTKKKNNLLQATEEKDL